MRTEAPSKCSRCRRYCRLATTFLFSHVGLCALVVGYAIVGAFTFEALEAGSEQQKREEFVLRRSSVVETLWNLTETSWVLMETNWTSQATAALQDFEGILVRAVRKDGYDGKDDTPLQWSFSGALLYSIIVITTIGYGNIAPKTPWGKLVTILYAIIGIPLLLLCLSNIGDAMAHSFKFIYWKVCCYLCVKPKTRRKTRIHCRFPTTHQPSGTVEFIHSDSPLGDNGSRSSYYTAPVTVEDLSSGEITPSPMLSSPVSARSVHLSPNRLAPVHTSCKPTKCQVDIVPVITNRYAVQINEDISHPSAGQVCYSLSPPRNRFNEHWVPPYFEEANKATDDESSSPSTDTEEDVTVPMWLCLLLVISYICGGAVLFTFWEKWNFLDSSYFCFVTLTTIGFGDLVPGTAVLSDDAQLTLGLCSLYLLFGMALLAMSFNLVQEEVTKSVKCVGRRIGIISEDN